MSNRYRIGMSMTGGVWNGGAMGVGGWCVVCCSQPSWEGVRGPDGFATFIRNRGKTEATWKAAKVNGGQLRPGSAHATDAALNPSAPKRWKMRWEFRLVTKTE